MLFLILIQLGSGLKIEKNSPNESLPHCPPLSLLNPLLSWDLNDMVTTCLLGSLEG